MCYILTCFRTSIKLFANLQQIEYNSIKQLVSVHMQNEGKTWYAFYKTHSLFTTTLKLIQDKCMETMKL